MREKVRTSAVASRDSTAESRTCRIGHAGPGPSTRRSPPPSSTRPPGRARRTGQGDSEGGPTIDADFDTELAAYEALLAALPSYAFVDTSRIYMLGYSMGGSFAALAAADRAPGVAAPRGVAVYGTMAKSRPEYWLANARRQLTLAGTPAGEVHRTVHGLAQLTTHLIDGESEGIAGHP